MSKNKSSKDKDLEVRKALEKLPTDDLDKIRREWQSKSKKLSKEAASSALTWYILEKMDKVSVSANGKIRTLYYETCDDLGEARFENEDEFNLILKRLNNSSHQTNGLVGIYWSDDGEMFVDKIMLFYKGQVFNKEDRSLQLTSLGNFHIFGFLSELKDHKNTVLTIVHRKKSNWSASAKRAASLMKVANQNLVTQILQKRRGYITPKNEGFSKETSVA